MNNALHLHTLSEKIMSQFITKREKVYLVLQFIIIIISSILIHIFTPYS